MSIVKSRAQPLARFSIANADRLCKEVEQIEEVETVGPSERSLYAIRELTEVLVYADRHNEMIFDRVMGRQFMYTLERIVTNALLPSSAKFQVLHCVTILLKNLIRSSSVYLVCSNNHINRMIMIELDETDDELVSMFVSFLKTLTLRLNVNSVQFFFDDKSQTFPLFHKAVKLMKFSDAMVRTTARQIVISVCQLPVANIHRFLNSMALEEVYHVISKSMRHWLVELAQLFPESPSIEFTERDTRHSRRHPRSVPSILSSSLHSHINRSDAEQDSSDATQLSYRHERNASLIRAHSHGQHAIHKVSELLSLSASSQSTFAQQHKQDIDNSSAGKESCNFASTKDMLPSSLEHSTLSSSLHASFRENASLSSLQQTVHTLLDDVLDDILYLNDLNQVTKSYASTVALFTLLHTLIYPLIQRIAITCGIHVNLNSMEEIVNELTKNNVNDTSSSSNVECVIDGSNAERDESEAKGIAMTNTSSTPLLKTRSGNNLFETIIKLPSCISSQLALVFLTYWYKYNDDVMLKEIFDYLLFDSNKTNEERHDEVHVETIMERMQRIKCDAQSGLVYKIIISPNINYKKSIYVNILPYATAIHIMQCESERNESFVQDCQELRFTSTSLLSFWRRRASSLDNIINNYCQEYYYYYYYYYYEEEEIDQEEKEKLHICIAKLEKLIKNVHRGKEHVKEVEEMNLESISLLEETISLFTLQCISKMECEQCKKINKWNVVILFSALLRMLLYSPFSLSLVSLYTWLRTLQNMLFLSVNEMHCAHDKHCLPIFVVLVKCTMQNIWNTVYELVKERIVSTNDTANNGSATDCEIRKRVYCEVDVIIPYLVDALKEFDLLHNQIMCDVADSSKMELIRFISLANRSLQYGECKSNVEFGNSRPLYLQLPATLDEQMKVGMHAWLLLECILSSLTQNREEKTTTTSTLMCNDRDDVNASKDNNNTNNVIFADKTLITSAAKTKINYLEELLSLTIDLEERNTANCSLERSMKQEEEENELEQQQGVLEEQKRESCISSTERFFATQSENTIKAGSSLSVSCDFVSWAIATPEHHYYKQADINNYKSHYQLSLAMPSLTSSLPSSSLSSSKEVREEVLPCLSSLKWENVLVDSMTGGAPVMMLLETSQLSFVLQEKKFSLIPEHSCTTKLNRKDIAKSNNLKKAIGNEEMLQTCSNEGCVENSNYNVLCTFCVLFIQMEVHSEFSFRAILTYNKPAETAIVHLTFRRARLASETVTAVNEWVREYRNKGQRVIRRLLATPESETSM